MKTPVLMLLLVVGGVAAVVGWRYYSASRSASSPTPWIITTTPADLPPSQMVIGTKEVTRGRFLKVEDNSLFLDQSDSTVRYSLTDEVVLACTDQQFTEAAVLDTDQVQAIQVLPQNALSTKLDPGLQLVALASRAVGPFRVHAVAVPLSVCPQ